MSVVFLQKRAHKAGAQTCLARLLAHPGLRDRQPVLVCSETGWLTRECERLGVTCLVENFPSARSLTGRLMGNAAFARRVAARLREGGLKPDLVHANDYLEGPLALPLAKALNVPSAVFLRAGGMASQDFRKYGCGSFDLLIAVGDELRDRAAGWTSKPVLRIYDGIAASEFQAPKPKSDSFPREVLVIGSPLAAKGWADVTAAVAEVPELNAPGRLALYFTGDPPDPARNDLGLDRIPGVSFRFLGRVEGFADLVRQYDLVINPSRTESFGMAAIEVIAAGVPLLSSRVGVIGQVVTPDQWLFAPGSVGELADRLRSLERHWSTVSFDGLLAQSLVRQRFLIDTSVADLLEAYRKLA